LCDREHHNRTRMQKLLLLIAVVSLVNAFHFRNGVVRGHAGRLRFSGLDRPGRQCPVDMKARPRALDSRLFMGEVSPDNPFYAGQDAYQILEIPRSATKKEVKSAYRKAVAKWHPDKFPDDEKKKEEGGKRMEKINRAYFCLEEDDRRKRYDQFGEQGVGTSAASEEQMKAAGGPGFGGFGGAGGQAVDVQDISDIFDAFFGGQGGAGGQGGMPRGGGRGRTRNPNAPIAGDDLQIDIEVPFMTAVFGGQEKIRVRRLEECGTCTGSGVKPGAKVTTCQTCGGQGVVNNMQRTPFGVFNNVQTCPNCRGTGQQIEEYCPTCGGKGANVESKEVVIRVPAGIEAGSSLRVRDAGNAGKRGGPRGDLFVQVSVKRDPRFKRDGVDVYTEEEISYTEAILGTTVKATTLDGDMDVKIPIGTQPEQKLRLKGKGIPKLGASDVRGDAYITVKVKIPTTVSGKEKELVEQINAINGGRTSGSNGKQEDDKKKSVSRGDEKDKKKKGFFGL
jgi:molecular chaperone DnaJ